MKKSSSKEEVNYYKEEKQILMYKYNYAGPYLGIEFNFEDLEQARKMLTRCPICGSNKLKPSIFPSWKSERLNKLIHDDVVQGWPGCLVIGAKMQTRQCLKCDCMWHSEADLFYWNELYKANGDLSDEELGIDYLHE